MKSGPMVSVEALSKVFRIPVERHTTLKSAAVNLFRTGGHRRLDALNNVSFEVADGEFFSVIGSNGSGKSTLLKILAGIYQPTSGTVRLGGRLSPFIELGVGFNPELTARDNVFLNGVILGLSRREILALFDAIIDFAELGDFVDQKLKNFSSGMLVRLAFSIAVRAHAEILLVDEVLAVGDANFQRKCFDVFSKLKAEGRTIVFVSHDLGAVRQFSDRVMLLERGVSHGVFSPAAGVAEYARLNDQRADAELARGDLSVAARSDEPQLRSVEIRSRGERTHVVHTGDRVSVLIEVENRASAPVQVGIAIHRIDGLYCFGTNTFISRWEPIREPQFQVELEYERFPLRRGSYYLEVGLFGDRVTKVHEMRDRAYDFQVSSPDEYDGVVVLEHSWRLGGD